MQNDKQKFKNDFQQRLIKLTVNTLTFTDTIRKNRNLWPLADQLIRSSASIGANVIEAKSASSKRDYLRFFEIALKSANETKYWLLVISDYSPAFSSPAQTLLKEVEEAANIIGASVLTLKSKR